MYSDLFSIRSKLLVVIADDDRRMWLCTDNIVFYRVTRQLNKSRLRQRIRSSSASCFRQLNLDHQRLRLITLRPHLPVRRFRPHLRTSFPTFLHCSHHHHLLRRIRPSFIYPH